MGMVPAGFEPTTFRLTVDCSNQTELWNLATYGDRTHDLSVKSRSLFH